METLHIRWQRLLVDGATCPRCASTEEELERACALLEQILAPLGIGIVLEKAILSREDFQKDPLQSNAIVLNGRPLEEWLGASQGASPCCDVCGPVGCRTVETDGQVHEAIPAELIVRAALLAVSASLSECSHCGPSCCSLR
ncbi:DUF2703 domain-containing protein [Candidatus Caldatribacterium saccharofermentans]|uniref:DUF2703 domain-containing protein n=1 Tax=Candidatus Caldatribacterium saccharofermentans TaxID=1454753 RepID=A0A7V4THR2_9BACT